MNVLSLFDGMSCGQIALERAGIEVHNYYASEIDKHAIKVTKNNYPETIQLGDINNWKQWDIDWSSIDLVMAGSPCQGFSFAGKQLAFDDPRSKLFFVFVDICHRVADENPKMKFLLENVKMKPQFLEVINEKMGMQGVPIDSSNFSAQNRLRYYWTNIKNLRPMKRTKDGAQLSQILEALPDCPIGIKVREKSNCIRVGGRTSPFGSKQIWDSPFQRVTKSGKVKPGTQKSACLTGGGNSGGNHSDMDIIHTPWVTRRYSVIECERLQTVPDNYTNHVSNTQRYKMLGNGWNIDTIVHILK
jgi:DNA-cytosine methyltransferase